MDIIQDTTINGRDVSIYETGNGLTVDIKHPCDELIKGWEGIEKFFTAESLAKTYIYALGLYTKPHCGDEYCIQAFKQQQRGNNESK